MPINLQCPNPKCGRKLAIGDEHAGKKVKCPHCEFAFYSPQLQEVDALLVPEAYEVEDQGDYKQHTGGKPPQSGSNVLNIILFAVGTVLLLLLALIPLFTWFSLKSSTVRFGGVADVTISVNGTGGMQARMSNPISKKVDVDTAKLPSKSRPKGLYLLLVFIAVTLMIGVGFGLGIGNVFSDRTSKNILSLSSMTGSGAGMICLVWMIAWFWKVHTLSTVIKELLNNLAEERRDSITVSLGPGLFLGAVVAVGVTFVFSFLASRYIKAPWIVLANVLGLSIGFLILVLVVEPWEAHELWKSIIKPG